MSGAARIGDDAAISQRARPPLGAPLKPAENFPGGDFLRRFLGNHFFVKLGNLHALALQAAGGDGRAHLLGRVARPPVGIFHDERTRLAENLMMHEISGADREPRISRSGLHEDLFERRLIENFPVGHAIERHAAGQANGLLLGSGVQRAKHFEQDLFEARLQRGRAVTMHLFDRSRGIARRPQALGHVVGIHRAQFGSLVGVAPGHFRAGAMVLEIFESQAEADASVGADNVAELVQVGRLAVSGQAHDFVFVAEFAKSQILRHGRVIHAERMGKRNRPVDVHAIAPAGSPHGAGEIAEAVRGKQRGLFERRNEKRARQVRLVMLDAVILGSNLVRRDIERLRERFRNSHEPGHHFGPFAGKTRHPQGVQEFCPEARPGIARDRDVVDFTQRDAGGVQAVADRRRRKSRRVLHAVKAFFFDGGDQPAVRNNRRGGIAVIGVDSQGCTSGVVFPSLKTAGSKQSRKPRRCERHLRSRPDGSPHPSRGGEPIH